MINKLLNYLSQALKLLLFIGILLLLPLARWISKDNPEKASPLDKIKALISKARADVPGEPPPGEEEEEEEGSCN